MERWQPRETRHNTKTANKSIALHMQTHVYRLYCYPECEQNRVPGWTGKHYWHTA